MKSKIVIAFVLLAFGASAATKVQTQHFEVADSVRYYEPDDPQSDGYKFSNIVIADWPTTVNGKKSQALYDFLLEEVFYASQNPNSFPGKINDVNTLIGCVKNWTNYLLRNSVMANEHIVTRAKDTITHFETAGLLDKMAEYGITWEEIDAALANEEF